MFDKRSLLAAGVAAAIGCGAAVLPAATASAAAPIPAANSAPTALSPLVSPLPIISEEIFQQGSGSYVNMVFGGVEPKYYAVVTNTATGGETDYLEVTAAGRFGFQLPILAGKLNTLSVTLTNYDDPADTTTFTHDVDDRRPDLTAPEVTTSIEGKSVVFDVSGLDGAQAVIRNADGLAIAGQRLTGGKTRLLLADTGRETTYDVVQVQENASSEATRVVVNEGAGASRPVAPVVTAALVSETRALATVEGEAGGTLRVTDSSGKLVAAGVIGASGRKQLLVPTSVASASSPLEAVVKIHGSTSDYTRFTIAP
ncbi:hypothetical protein [Frondihabitans sp. VKM Ac-2883]|uniref:hypothetical protein n=1 Tax=Frondihabitans sp. VKM Ac-2883 TaxID=2783823 RepID=UPI00188DAA1E|nr:hypothetical protein [Frondihabitans sp. VKM Ac-2883]MBF4575721.1 hypothetical protein [Frondihabitans sp. VKM Ac-2883]